MVVYTYQDLIFTFFPERDTDTYDYQHSWASAETGFLFDSFFGEAEGKWSKVSTESFSSNYSLDFSFGDLSTIQVMFAICTASGISVANRSEYLAARTPCMACYLYLTFRCFNIRSDF